LLGNLAGEQPQAPQKGLSQILGMEECHPLTREDQQKLSSPSTGGVNSDLVQLLGGLTTRVSRTGNLIENKTRVYTRDCLYLRIMELYSTSVRIRSSGSSRWCD